MNYVALPKALMAAKDLLQKDNSERTASIAGSLCPKHGRHSRNCRKPVYSLKPEPPTLSASAIRLTGGQSRTRQHTMEAPNLQLELRLRVQA